MLDLAPAGAQHVLGQIERKTISVIEPESGFAGERLTRPELGRFFFQKPQAAVEGLLEIGLFKLERLGDERLGPHQLRVGGAHLLYQCRHQPPHQWLFAAEHMGMPHRPPHDPAQHIPTPLLARQYAIGN